MTNKLAAINPNELMAYIDTLYSDHYEQAYDQTVHDIFNAVRRRIRRCQALDVTEVKHGYWIEFEEQAWHLYQLQHFTRIKCSCCDQRAFKKSAYCPHCGARMDLE